MLSIFKKNNQQTPKPSSLIHSITRISYGDDVDALPTLVTPARGGAGKSRKTSRGSTTTRFESTTIMSISSSSSSFISDSPASRPLTGIADLVLQPHNYTAFLFQAPGDRDSTERPSISTTVAPRETPFSHDSICTDTPPAIFVNGIDHSEANTLIKCITYEATLASTLHRNLGVTEGTKYWDIAGSRTAGAIQEGGFSSLTGVSMAIMEGRVSLPCT